jgi:hypothetical protein
MSSFLKMLGNKPQNHFLAILLTIFVIFDIKIPLPIAQSIDNILGKIAIVGIALSLIKYDKLIGILALVACIVLIERASNVTGTGPMTKFLPNEETRQREMVDMNPEFPVTLEEETIQNMMPYTTPDITDPEYKPIQEKVHDAERV